MNDISTPFYIALGKAHALAMNLHSLIVERNKEVEVSVQTFKDSDNVMVKIECVCPKTRCIYSLGKTFTLEHAICLDPEAVAREMIIEDLLQFIEERLDILES